MHTPLWLNLKKEYIDDNFDSLLTYLKDYSLRKDKDAFYDTTVQLLRQRVQGLVDDCCARPIYEETEGDATFDIRLLAAYLLLNDENPLALPAYLALMRRLLATQHKFALQVMKNVSGRLRAQRIAQHGYAWSDLIDYHADMFAYKAIHNVIFGVSLRTPQVLEQHGTALLTAKGLRLTSVHTDDAKRLLTSGSESLGIDLLTSILTSASLKLKQSQQSNLMEMYAFTEDFCQQQAKCIPGSRVKKLHTYTDSEEMTVRITDISYSGVLSVETVDPNYERVKGRIVFQKLGIMYYYSNMLPHYFRVGNTFPVTLLDAGKGTFQMDDQLIRFIVEECREANGTDEYILESVLIDKRPTHYVWLTNEGTPVHTSVDEEYEKGDYAFLNITEYCSGRHYGMIKGEIVRRITDSADMFNDSEVRTACIQRFGHSSQAPEPVVETPEDTALSPATLGLLMRLLFHYQKDLLKPSDRFRFLMNARALASLLGDDIDDSYLRFASTYLMILVHFTHHIDISQMTLTPDERYAEARPTRIRLLIVSLLQQYGRQGYSEELSALISQYQTELPLIAKLARLIQTANTMSDTLSHSALSIIRREIIRTLSLETEHDTDLEDENGEYLGVESGTQEFKESIVYPPNNHMQPSPNQQLSNVMRGLCAFLNSETGGTLYLGVNDQGYVVGVDNDMQYLHCQTVDSYMRYIQDEAIRLMGTDAAYYLHTEPLFNGRCISIRVDSHPYRIVEMEKVAYVRINAESRQMPDSVREAIMKRKFGKDQSSANILPQLYQAQSDRKRVILHNYSSSNSLNTTDRSVEVYKILPTVHLVVGFDIEKDDVRIYNLNRVGYVETTDVPWHNADRHRDVQVDDFHMAGSQPIHVSLELDLFGRNLLVEEFPLAKQHLTADKRSSLWYYDADVYSLEGIGRFYIGLANHIHILKGAELEKYVKEFAGNWLK
jgi:predicted DNA-binding transcriptional regulator YafY